MSIRREERGAYWTISVARSQDRYCGNGDPERLGGPQVDHEHSKFGGLLDGQVVRFRALQNLVYVGGPSDGRLQTAFGP